jgi:putative membrane protein
MSEQKSPNIALEKKLNIGAYIVSGVVLVLVATMHKIHINHNIDFTFLPALYSVFNALTAVVLIYALVQIKKRNVDKHRKAIYLAMVFSVFFLLGYVVYHLSYPDTKYCGVGNIRYVYFTMLITHIVLAAAIFPFILFTFIRAYTGQYDRHKKMARWVFPLWLYVAVTGPILFLMIRPCYPWVIN